MIMFYNYCVKNLYYLYCDFELQMIILQLQQKDW